MMALTNAISPLAFFGRLKWLDGRPLLDTIEPYRRALFMRSLFDLDAAGVPRINFVLSGRAKKNFKTTDLVLAALYRLLIWESSGGNDCFILANDEGQANDDLVLAKKLVAANPEELGNDVEVLAKTIRRKRGEGSLTILPAGDAKGAHGKTAIFLGFDEIHSYRTHDLFEALAPDPTRADVLTWITSYDTIFNAAGVPLYDFKDIGQRGADPRMLFSWYSAGLCTDPAFADLTPEARANPSMASWPSGMAYLEQQRIRLPTHKFRRLHLNLPGAPSGAVLNPDVVLKAVVGGRTHLPPESGVAYRAFVDMSGGSADDATFAIAHRSGKRKAVVDLVIKQVGNPPFDPRAAVRQFAAVAKLYSCSTVHGDRYAGQTFRADFEAEGIRYSPSTMTATHLYEALEPRLNAGEVELPDVAKLQEQLLMLVLKGSKIEHPTGEHDDFANACAGAVEAAVGRRLYGMMDPAVLGA